MKNKTHVKSKRSRYRAPKSTLSENCRVILTPNGDRGLQACFKRHVKEGSITDKTN